jgi:hypothetical protein
MPRRKATSALRVTPEYCRQRAREAQQEALQLDDPQAVKMLEVARLFRELADIIDRPKSSPSAKKDKD